MRYLFSVVILASGMNNAWSAIKPTKPTQAIIFINSAVTEQMDLVREVSRQLSYSSQLKRNLTVTFIDINPKGLIFSGPANFLKDEKGVWVGKYLPSSIPSLLCIKKGKVFSDNKDVLRGMRLCR